MVHKRIIRVLFNLKKIDFFSFKSYFLPFISLKTFSECWNQRVAESLRWHLTLNDFKIQKTKWFHGKKKSRITGLKRAPCLFCSGFFFLNNLFRDNINLFSYEICLGTIFTRSLCFCGAVLNNFFFPFYTFWKPLLFLFLLDVIFIYTYVLIRMFSPIPTYVFPENRV